MAVGTNTIPATLTVYDINATTPVSGGLYGSVLIYSPRPGIAHRIYTPTGSGASCALNDVYVENDTGIGSPVFRQGVVVTNNQGGTPTLNRFFMSRNTGSTPWNTPDLTMDSSGNLILGGGTSGNGLLTLAASTTARAVLAMTDGSDPTSPTNGNLWFSTRLKFRRSGNTELIATGVQGTGGVATAGASYTATEQTMLQAVYNAARTFGLLS
jgi:hypothetical protein